MIRVIDVQLGEGRPPTPGGPGPRAVLAHDERHLRRKAIALSDGSKVLIDLPTPTVLNAGDTLVLDNGARIPVEAAPEDLYDIRGTDAEHLLHLAWHIGNRHLPAELRVDRILIGRDHVIRTMLQGLGATVTDVTGPFSPARGAYAEHGAGQGDGHGHHHGAAHDH